MILEQVEREILVIAAISSKTAADFPYGSLAPKFGHASHEKYRSRSTLFQCHFPAHDSCNKNSATLSPQLYIMPKVTF